MKKSIFPILFILLASFSLSYGAVIQEPAADNPETFKTLYLFNSETVPEKAQDISKAHTGQTSSKVEENIQTESTKNTLEIDARYIRPTVNSVQSILKKYKSIPGGITLEGAASGLNNIKELSFDRTKNTFIINNSTTYRNPVSPFEMKSIIEALEKNDKLGVSLGQPDIIYGDLKSGSIPSIYMKLADHYLGCIVFANSKWIRDQLFPNNFKPKAPFKFSGGYAVYFNFSNFLFNTENGRLTPEKSSFTTMIIPLTRTKGPQGGYLPDFKKISSGNIPSEFEKNAIHIINNTDFYMNEPRIAKTQAYGEAAAFARTLLKNEIDLDSIISKLK